MRYTHLPPASAQDLLDGAVQFEGVAFARIEDQLMWRAGIGIGVR